MHRLTADADSTQGRPTDAREPRQARSWVATLAATLAVVYAIPHIWWGLGIDWLAPADLSADTGLGSNTALRLFAFYGMGFLALLSGFLTLAMSREMRPQFPTWFIALHGWGIGVLLLIRGGIGLTETVLISAGARDCPFAGCRQGEPGRDSIGLTGLFWEPLFVAWSLALLATVVLWSRTKA